jgi:glycosyltransferase involved in cell wall biosynthesis
LSIPVKIDGIKTRESNVLTFKESGATSQYIGAPKIGCALISVIVPCFNYGHFLAEALESLLSQTWTYWECIVVDDGSTDNTAEVVRFFQARDTRIKYVHQQNQGLSAARNAGLQASGGAYIQFLDADDKLEAKKLEIHVGYLEEHPEVGIVYGSVCFFKEDSLNLDVDLDKRDGGAGISGAGKDVLSFLIRGNIMVVNAPLVRNSVLNDVGKFNQNLLGHEDWDYWIRCALAGKRFHYLKEPDTRALVRVHQKSMTQDVIGMLASDLRVRERLQATPLPKALRNENNYRIGVQFAKIAKLRLRRGERLGGLWHAVLAISRSRLNARALIFVAAHFLPESLANKLKALAKKLRDRT